MGLALLEETAAQVDNKEMLFYDAVELSPLLKVVSVDSDACYVSNARGCFFSVLWETVVQVPLEELLEVLCEKREAIILDPMTRIVGYYSQISNWNKSKLGELEARRKASAFYTI